MSNVDIQLNKNVWFPTTMWDFENPTLSINQLGISLYLWRVLASLSILTKVLKKSMFGSISEPFQAPGLSISKGIRVLQWSIYNPNSHSHIWSFVYYHESQWPFTLCETFPLTSSIGAPVSHSECSKPSMPWIS